MIYRRCFFRLVKSSQHRVYFLSLQAVASAQETWTIRYFHKRSSHRKRCSSHPSTALGISTYGLADRKWKCVFNKTAGEPPNMLSFNLRCDLIEQYPIPVRRPLELVVRVPSLYMPYQAPYIFSSVICRFDEEVRSRKSLIILVWRH